MYILILCTYTNIYCFSLGIVLGALCRRITIIKTLYIMYVYDTVCIHISIYTQYIHNMSIYVYSCKEVSCLSLSPSVSLGPADGPRPQCRSTAAALAHCGVALNRKRYERGYSLDATERASYPTRHRPEELPATQHAGGVLRNATRRDSSPTSQMPRESLPKRQPIG